MGDLASESGDGCFKKSQNIELERCVGALLWGIPWTSSVTATKPNLHSSPHLYALNHKTAPHLPPSITVHACPSLTGIRQTIILFASWNRLIGEGIATLCAMR